MEKLKRFAYEHKKEIAVFAVLLGITILLCVPFTLGYAVKVFGWAVWFYLGVGYLGEILHCAKKQVNLTVKSAVFLILAVFFSLAALHVAFITREQTGTFTDYIVGSYQNGTVGGAVFGIITSPVAVGFTYVWAIVFFMVMAALFFFLFFRPFIFEGTRNPVYVGKKKKKVVEKPVCHEIILDEAPFLNKNAYAIKREPVPYMVVGDPDKNKEKDARELLFGGEKTEGYHSSFGEDDSYNVTRYKFGTFIREEEKADEEQATEMLFGDEEQAAEPVLNYDDEPESVIFDDEEDENITDLFKPRENPFFQALKQNANDRFAPSPITYDEVTADNAESEESEEEEKPAERKTDVPVSGDYVYVNGMLVPVMKTVTPPTQPVAAAMSNPSEYTRPEEPQFSPYSQPRNVDEPPQPGYHKIVQLVERPNLPYNKPPISLLKTHVTEGYTETVDNWDELKEIFENRLLNFGITAQLVDAIKGPTVTLCAIKLGEKCPISKLYSIKTDLQRWLRSSKPIAIIPQIPNTDYCGVQIPNEIKGVVGFKEIISSKEYREKKGDIVVALGKTAEGEIYVEDLAAMPHALVAGETGSGKSVCLNTMLMSVLFRYSPDEVKFVLIDLKQVEMELYSGLPHMLLKEPLNTIPEIVNVLKWIKEEVSSRFTLFKKMHMKNLNEYNNQEGVEKLARIIIVIDEASELMSDVNARKTLENTLNSLARIARAAGVHLIFATQNPVKTVITSEIQNNLPTKIALAVSDYVHSMVIFKAKGAECLLGHGDMYIKRGQEMVRVQGAYIATEEIEDVVNYIKDNNEYSFNDLEIARILNGTAMQKEEPNTVTTQQQRPASGYGGGAQQVQAQQDNAQPDDGTIEPDATWLALKYCVDANYVSCSYLQRKLKKGYNTVANILEELAAKGYVSSVPQGSKEKREVLISKEDFYKEWEERYGEDEVHALENFDPSDDEE